MRSFDIDSDRNLAYFKWQVARRYNLWVDRGRVRDLAYMRFCVLAKSSYDSARVLVEAMLKELEIRDFALIKHLRVPFTPGFNILTGETGAGKSIIIDALNAVLGGRVTSSVIRPGAERATAEASFACTPEVLSWLKSNELLDEDFGDELVISREVSKSGSRARVNGTLVNLSALQELRQKLLTIHTQHEARTLQASQAQLEMLDALGDEDHKKLLTQVRTLHARLKEVAQEIADIDISEEERHRRIDFARFQLDELLECNLQDEGEDECIANQVRALSHVVELEETLTQVQQWLNDGDGSPSAIELIQRAALELSKAAQLDSNLDRMTEAFNTCADMLEEQYRELRRYLDRLDTDPETLSTLESRLAQLSTIKRKHGPTLAEAITRRTVLEEELAGLDNAQSTADGLRDEHTKIQEQLLVQAGKLSKKRRALADGLAERIQAELFELGMANCRFSIALDRGDKSESAIRTECGPDGVDRAEFLIAPNPGQPLLPVSKIASGGELSRVMLAVKSIFAHADNVSTVIFDEIETGLSGKVLQAMRDKLARLALSHQILCITHQPMIACIADNHIEVTKHHGESETSVTADVLDLAARLSTVAGMASGQERQTEALQFAQSLFADGDKLRISLRGI